MRLASNRRGMYEYILTKSVMLIFIMGLVGIFMSFYSESEKKSANNIVNSEAERVAKQIDDIIGFRGVSNSANVYLSQDLYVGKESVPYILEIYSNGVITVNLTQYPYHGVVGIAQFGMRVKMVGGHSDKIECNWNELNNGAKLFINKTSINWWNTKYEHLHYNVSISIDAKECGNYMEFFEDFCEGEGCCADPEECR